MSSKIILALIIGGVLITASVMYLVNNPANTLHPRDGSYDAESDTPTEEVAALSSEIENLRQDLEEKDTRHNTTLEGLNQVIAQLNQKIEQYSDPEAAAEAITQEISDLRATVQELQTPSPASPTLQYEVGPAVAADGLVWIEPLVPPQVAAAPTSLGATESASRTQYTIPAASIVYTRALTALVGRIPVNGRLENAWRFKLISRPDNFTSKLYSVPDLEGVIWTGLAHGDYTLSCVSGTIDTITFVFRDGTIHTQRSPPNPDDVTQGLGWISDEYGNPCLPGVLKTNAPQFIRRSVLSGFFSGLSRGYADAQTTRTHDRPNNQTIREVTGDQDDYALANAAADAVSQTEQWMRQRMNQSFDAIYLPAGQNVVIHIEQQVQLDYDPSGRQIDHRIARKSSQGDRYAATGSVD